MSIRDLMGSKLRFLFFVTFLCSLSEVGLGQETASDTVAKSAIQTLGEVPPAAVGAAISSAGSLKVPIVPKDSGNDDRIAGILGSVSQPTRAFPATQKYFAASKIFIQTIKACAKARAETQTECEESNSGFLKEMMRNSAAIASVVANAIRARDSCSKIADGVGLISALMPLYQSGCQSGRTSCLDSCGEAIQALERMKQTKTAVVAEINKAAGVENISIEWKMALTKEADSIEAADKIVQTELSPAGDSVTEHKSYCMTKAGAALASGIATAGQALKLGSQASDCIKKTDGDGTTKPVVPAMTEQECAAKPSEPQCSCDLPAHANTKRCLCIADPRNLACNGGGHGSGELQKLGAGGMGLGVGGSGTDKAKLDLSEPESDPMITLPPKGADEQPAHGNAGIGGGFGGGPGGNQIGGPNSGGGGGAVSKATNPGGFMGSGGSVGRLSNNDDEEAEKKKKRGIAEAQEKLAGAMLAREISSTGGKSNWEKVKIRYTDNAPTLLGK